MTALHLDDVVKSYGDTVAVNHVSLSLEQGEFLTLLGPSGSGKTTTLKIVAGFESPDNGTVQISDKDVTATPPQHRNLGMVFQHYALFPHMTVAQNVAFPLVMRKTPREEIRKRVLEVLELVNLSGFDGRRPRQLSGGQQQRVALARAIVFRPELLLMDEPLGALDKKLREHLQVEIMRLQKETGITVVYVTHDQEEALLMSDRIAIYRDGRVEQIGDAETLYESPESVFVADFMGESNIFTNGSSAVVVRPERIRLAAADARTDGADTVTRPGVVTGALYLGNSRKYIVTLTDGKEVSVLCHPGESWAEFAVDDRVRVEWRAADSVTVPS